MNMLMLLNMVYPLFSPVQPNWDSIARTYLPVSEMEIMAEIQKVDEWRLKEDTFLRSYLDTNELSYRTDYEFTQILNEFSGKEVSIAISKEMVKNTLPILNIYVWIGEDGKVYYSLRDGEFDDRPNPKAHIWHSDGIYFGWMHDREIKISGGYRKKNQKAVKLMNRFLDQPYVFNICHIGHCWRAFEYIGVVENGRLVVTDVDGNHYDGIDGLILKKYGSVENYKKTIDYVLEKELQRDDSLGPGIFMLDDD